MVIVTRPRRRNLKRDLEEEHDFPQGQDRCAKCGMRLRVWEDTHVPCSGKQMRHSTDGYRQSRAAREK
jgi:hypothetical protein